MTTCQICGRAIKAPLGYPKYDGTHNRMPGIPRRTIAHHGFKRPRHGWQTSSCFGARWRPYEAACDALPPAIAGLANFLALAEARLAKFIAEPPAVLEYDRDYRRFGGGSWKAEKKTVERPVGFDVAKVPSAWSPGSYEGEWARERNRMQTEIKYAREDLAAMRKRLAEWKPEGSRL